MNFLERSWIDHCHGRYPREFGIPARFNKETKDYVWNIEDLLRYGHRYNGVKNCYISTLSFQDPRNYGTGVLDTIYCDFDCEDNPQLAIDDALKLITVLHKRCIYPRVYFSGSKGIALYIDFNPFDIMPEYVKPVVALFQDTTKERLSLTTLDPCTKDAQSRISRLPNTKHMSSGLYCVPLAFSDLTAGIDHIRELATKPRDVEIKIYASNCMPSILKKYEKVVIKQRQDEKLIKEAQALKDKLGLGFQRRNGQITKCAGVIHAEQGARQPGREPTACGLILAYSLWYDMTKGEIKSKLRSWVARCKPQKEWGIVEDRIERFYNNKQYSPCTFLMKTEHCRGSDCAVIRRRRMR